MSFDNWMHGVNSVRVEPPDLSTDSMDSVDYTPLVPPGEEHLLRTSPHGEHDEAQAGPTVPLPGAQGAGSIQPQTQGDTARRSPIPIMSPEELQKVEHNCRRHNQATSSLRNMLSTSVAAINTRIQNIKKAAPNGPIRPAVLEGLKRDLR